MTEEVRSKVETKRRALLSVSDKQGLIPFAQGLSELGFELVSTGGTARALADAGLPVIPIEQVTGFPEMMDGRVKTLHPRVHGGLLGRRSLPEHRAAMSAHDIRPIDVVVVNLYPFRETIARSGVTFDEAIEQIDIGGPAMIRSAAKNHEDVVVVTSPEQYESVLATLRKGGPTRLERRRLALAAFEHTASYDAAISAWMKKQVEQAEGSAETSTETPAAVSLTLPDRLDLSYERVAILRYGENPHQQAALYRAPGAKEGSLAWAKPLQGKELSYNNLNDAQAAWELVRTFEEPAAVAVKHANPCGVAIGDDLLTAYRRAHAADPVSIFGGIVALNREVDEELAKVLNETFLEVLLAPSYTSGALRVLSEKKNLRVLALDLREPEDGYELKRIDGGLLYQTADRLQRLPDSWRCVTKRQPEASDLEALWFAWRVVRQVKSNAIVVASAQQTLGVGAGQMNRIDSARIALRQAGEAARGAYLASDAFFPFSDVVEVSAEAGIRAIVQPGGSIRDAESIALADEKDMIMLFTEERHFLH